MLLLACGFILAGCTPKKKSTGPTDSEREHAAYEVWYKKYCSFPSRRIGMPPAPHDPQVPFNIARMYKEADLVVLCELGNYLDFDVGYQQLAQVMRVFRVHKGNVTVSKLEKTSHDLAICVMYDPTHTGSLGYCSFGGEGLEKGNRHLLFLNAVEDGERKARGYDKLKGKLYKVNRIWHGAIRIADKPRGGSEANFYIRRCPRFRKTRMFPQEACNALNILAAGEDDATTKSALLATLKGEIRFLDAKTDKGKRELADAVADNSELPGESAQTTPSHQIWKLFRERTDKGAKRTLYQRLLFRRCVLMDMVASWAGEREGKRSERPAQ